MLIKDLNRFREHVIKLFNNGKNIQAIADKYNINPAAISFLISSAGVDTKKYLKKQEVKNAEMIASGSSAISKKEYKLLKEVLE